MRPSSLQKPNQTFSTGILVPSAVWQKTTFFVGLLNSAVCVLSSGQASSSPVATESLGESGSLLKHKTSLSPMADYVHVLSDPSDAIDLKIENVLFYTSSN